MRRSAALPAVGVLVWTTPLTGLTRPLISALATDCRVAAEGAQVYRR